MGLASYNEGSVFLIAENQILQHRAEAINPKFSNNIRMRYFCKHSGKNEHVHVKCYL